MEPKKSIVFYEDWLSVIEYLPEEKQATLVLRLLRHVLRGEEESNDSVSKMFFGFVLSQIERDQTKWHDIKEKRANAGRKHKGNQYTRMEQNGTNGTNGTVNVDDNVDVDVDVDVDAKGSKENNKKKNSFSKRKAAQLARPEFAEMWKEWLGYREERGTPHPTLDSARKQYEQLERLAEGDTGKAKAIIDQAIAGGYLRLCDAKDYVNPAVADGFTVIGDDGKHYENMYNAVRGIEAWEDLYQEKR